MYIDEVDTLKLRDNNNQHYMTKEMGNIFKTPKSSIKNNFHQLGYVCHFDV